MEISRGIILGTALGAFNSLLCLVALRLAYHRSNKAFFGAFFAGVFWKLLILALTSVFLILHARSILISTLVSLAVATLGFNILEIRLLPENRTGAHGL